MRALLLAVTFLHLSLESVSFVAFPSPIRTTPRRCLNTGVVCASSGVVPRINLQEMSPSDFQALENGEAARPMIVSNVWEHGEEGREAWCDDLVKHLSGKQVEFQLQQPDGSFVFEAPFEDFLDCVFESHHGASYLLFDENLLSDYAPGLMKSLELPTSYFGEDLFPVFPEPLRPKDSCLVAGGRASRSKLHADPFEWVGWNYCFEGSKLWTFFPPQPPEVERELGAYRLEPNSWESGIEELAELSIAAGWQSELDIYHRLFGPDAPEPPWPSARELSEVSAEERRRSLRAIEEEAAELVPGGAWQQESAAPVEASGIEVGVQAEGELALIPAGWWHQTYHLEPSLAVASQYSNLANLPRVLRHIARWTGVSLPPSPPGLPPAQQVEALLRAAVCLRCPQPAASRVLRRLFRR